MVNNTWPTTWAKSALLAAKIEPTQFGLKAMTLWSKSTPTDAWTMNPIGIPSKGYTRRSVPGTPYALFLKYSEFSEAFTKAMQTKQGEYIQTLLTSGDSISKLWRAIGELNWPGSATENDYPREIHTWIGDDLRAKMNIPDKSNYKSSGTTDAARLNNHRVVQAHRAMITAQQSKLDLTKAIQFITRGVK
jgi:hypothetical protein